MIGENRQLVTNEPVDSGATPKTPAAPVTKNITVALRILHKYMAGFQLVGATGVVGRRVTTSDSSQLKSQSCISE